MRMLALCLAAVSLTACGTARRASLEAMPASYVDRDVTPQEAQTLATAMAGVAARRAQGPVEVIPAPGADPVAPVLADALRAAGARVASASLAPAHRLSYRVGSADAGLVMQMRFDRDLAAQPFDRDRGGLRPLGPIAVIEVPR